MSSPGPRHHGVAASRRAFLKQSAAAVGVAWLAAERHWGLLNQAALPSWSAVPITVIALDLVLYMQHVLFHRIPMLWRLHQVHHTDLDFDVTTGVRFHPLEFAV